MNLKISGKKYDIFLISVLLLIVGFCALRKIALFMYFAQLLFVFFCCYRLAKKHTFRFDMYTKTSILFSLFSIISIIWAASSMQAISALKPLIQLALIGILLNDYLDNEYKVECIWKYFIVSSVVLVVFLLIETPMSVWISAMQISTNASSSANRIGPSIGFQANWMGIICAFSIIIWIYTLTAGYTKKSLAITMIAVLAVIVIFTKSRKALIIMVAGPLMYWMLYKPRKKYIIILIPAMIFILFASIWAVFNIPFLYKMVGFRLIGLFSIFDSSIVADASVTTRADMVAIGVELFKKYPIGGVGFGNFSYHYFNDYSGWAQTYAHNNYVEILADTGIIGFVLYYTVPFSMFFRMIKNWKEYVNCNRKLIAFLLTFLFIRLVMDYGMVDYDDEFIQILTVNCYAALRVLDNHRKIKIHETY